MPLRLRLELRRGALGTVVDALVNTGFIAEEPDVMLSVDVAERLGLWPLRNLNFETLAARTASGAAPVYRILEGLRARILIEDRNLDYVELIPVVSEFVDGVLLSDAAAARLGIVVLDPAGGLWCLRDEVGRIVRRGI